MFGFWFNQVKLKSEHITVLNVMQVQNKKDHFVSIKIGTEWFFLFSGSLYFNIIKTTTKKVIIIKI